MNKEDKKEMILDYLEYLKREFYYNEFTEEEEDFNVSKEYSNFNINELHAVAYTTDDTGYHFMQIEIDFLKNNLIYIVDGEIILEKQISNNFFKNVSFGYFTSVASDISGYNF